MGLDLQIINKKMKKVKINSLTFFYFCSIINMVKKSNKVILYNFILFFVFNLKTLLRGLIGVFNVGDKIVYPMHGAGVIDSIEEKDILGEKQSYYILKMPSNVKVMVPTAKAEEVGIRSIIDKKDTEEVFKVLGQDETTMEKNWNKRYRDNMEKMKSGDIYEVADVVRNLSFKQKEKGLSTGEKKMLNNAKQILVSELALAEHSDQEIVEEQIDNKINTSFMTFRTEGVEQQSIVNKFIPFNGNNKQNA